MTKATEQAFTGWKLKLVALLCGASIMGLEMAGVRLLEPYLGSTIYVWGAIIGIFLGALALGYYFGGKFADHSPKSGTLATIILIAALLIFIIPPLGVAIGEWASASKSDPRLIAFISAFALYAIPSILLGMVSPFAVRLSAIELHKMGNVAGSLYAISTGGSIIGTFAVTFFLTEYFGTMYIIWGVGATLLIAAALCLSRKSLSNQQKAAAVIMICACIGGLQGAHAANASLSKSSVFLPGDYRQQSENGKNLDTKESPYHLINILQSKYNLDTQTMTPPGKECRYMVFNDQIESGCLINNDGTVAKPYNTACGYVRLLPLGVLVSGEKPRNIAIIGCGGGVGPQLFLQDYADSVEHIDVADIDPKVFEMAGKYFGYPYPDEPGGKISSYVKDGRRFLRGLDKKWDMIILDAYTAGGRIPRHLITQEFFQLAADKLTDDNSVVVCNIISGLKGYNGRLGRSVYKTLKGVFKNVYLFPRIGDPNVASNTIIVATNNPQKLSSIELAKKLIKLKGLLIHQPIDGAVNNSPAAEIDTTNDPLLTDDFCPTDSMSYLR